jgi:aspartyl-tRNA(Asn)/glutamyl-tRNA(Gln) amidotransferase subunit A
MQIYQLTAGQIKKEYQSGRAKPQDIVKLLLERIDAVEPKVKAFAHLDREEIERATQMPRCPDAHSDLSLAGIPVAIKDNICVKGQLTTCSSKILEGFKPPYNAAVVDRLQAEGAILFGKTNMDEFAFGSSCETSCYGPTKNPWDLNRIPGGSSGGSAAAVSSGEVTMALGSDTGGSIRQPAALCGVVGLKPTYGRVSRYGLIAFASSLDQIGPITKDVRDSALLMNAIAGYDERDSTSIDIAVPDFTKSLVNNVKKLKIAAPKEYFIEGIDNEVRAAIKKAIEVLTGLGATCEEVSLPYTEYAVSVYYILATAEASSNLARFDGVRYGYRVPDSSSMIEMVAATRGNGFGDEAKRRIILGTFVLSSGYYDAYYLKAQKVRTLIKQDFDEVFKKFDCIITPTSPTAAFKAGEKLGDPLSMYLSDIFTISSNLTGMPAMSIPCGFTSSGLPIGLQIIAKPFDEETIFRVAYTYEQNTEWHLRKPKL